MQYRVTFFVDVEADGEHEAHSKAIDAIEGFGPEPSFTVDELEEPHGEARTDTRS
jgi:hypothetical protein